MPNAMATARGHLDRTPANQLHDTSQAVSALRPHDTSQAVSALRRLHADQHTMTKISTPFDPTTIARSQTLHMDYTGRLQISSRHYANYIQSK
jgi:hypothetical protein